MIIDSHIHLDDKRYDEDLDEVLNRAREGGVKRFIIPGADPSTLDRAVEISEKYSDVYFAVGVHPYDMDSFDGLNFEDYVSHEKCVAIGECGLDYFRLEGSDEEKDAEKSRQKEVFVAQIELAKKYKKPLIIHIRDASRDSKKLLLELVPLVDRVVVSFATKSMIKKERFKVTRKWLVDFIKENFKILDDFEVGGERYVVFSKK